MKYTITLPVKVWNGRGITQPGEIKVQVEAETAEKAAIEVSDRLQKLLELANER